MSALLRYSSLLMLGLLHCAGCALHDDSAPGSKRPSAQAQYDPVDQTQLQQALSSLKAQRPGKIDLYVVGFAGDASEDVFRNETLYLRQLFSQRFNAGGRVLTLINHPDNLGEQPYAPLATYDNLYQSLQRIGAVMDRDEDLLLLFITTHGTEQHTLHVQVSEDEYDDISPQDLRSALDDAGIRNRIIVLSACYSGGFITALKSPDSLIMTAARADRPSFGCGNTANATYFGQAWLIDGLNQSVDFEHAFAEAVSAIAVREHDLDEPPSQPQLWRGHRIGTVMRHWRAQLHPGAAVPYPYPPVPLAD